MLAGERRADVIATTENDGPRRRFHLPPHRIQVKTLTGDRILQVVELTILLRNDDQAVTKVIESQPAQGDAVVAFILKRDGRQGTERVTDIVGQQRIGSPDVGARFGCQGPGDTDVDGVLGTVPLGISVGQRLVTPADGREPGGVQVEVDRHRVKRDRLFRLRLAERGIDFQIHADGQFVPRLAIGVGPIDVQQQRRSPAARLSGIPADVLAGLDLAVPRIEQSRVGLLDGGMLAYCSDQP